LQDPILKIFNTKKGWQSGSSGRALVKKKKKVQGTWDFPQPVLLEAGADFSP
jgi:hypothetical protein